MFSIEEAKATSPSSAFNIPSGATREFGKDAVERAIEEKTAAEQAETVKGIRAALAQGWRKFTRRETIGTHAKEAAR